MERKNGGTLGCLTCYVTATSQLLHEINYTMSAKNEHR